MRVSNHRHLTFCTNIYTGENWKNTFAELKQQLPLVTSHFKENKPFGIGLRLSNTASEELGLDQNLTDFKNWLDQNNLYVFTMNGFPYGDFHKEPVKDNVHAPDWTTPERLVYTKRLAEQLAVLLPEGISGGISTSPISYKHWYATEKSKDDVLKTGAKNMVDLAVFLEELEIRSGHHIHIDIEPEPDGLLENSDEVIDFFEDYLLPQAEAMHAGEIGQNAGKSTENEQKTADFVKKYLQICYDICHFSLAFEEPEQTFEKFAKSGIKIGKIQISSALKIIFDKANENLLWESLSRFNEATYLHQVTEKKDGKVITYRDLPVILAEKRQFEELRAHFHVPVFLEKFQGLYSTQDYILKTFRYLAENQLTDHLEVETYTWEVLPDSLKIDLSSSITRELQWVLENLKTTA